MPGEKSASGRLMLHGHYWIHVIFLPCLMPSLHAIHQKNARALRYFKLCYFAFSATELKYFYNWLFYVISYRSKLIIWQLPFKMIIFSVLYNTIYNTLVTIYKRFLFYNSYRLRFEISMKRLRRKYKKNMKIEWRKYEKSMK